MADLRVSQAGIDLEGHEFLGRGAGLTGDAGWSRRPDLAYRCAQCGTLMPGDRTRYFDCECGAMHLDQDMLRFGSRLGDLNILVYRRTSQTAQGPNGGTRRMPDTHHPAPIDHDSDAPGPGSGTVA